MRHTDRAINGGVRCVHEALFSGSIASALLTALIGSSIYWSGQFFGWEMGLNHSFNRMYNDSLGRTLAFCIWSLALTLAGFLLLRVLSRATLTERMLRTVAGVLVISAPPACLGFVACCRTIYPYWGWEWLRFEACAGVGCALLYVCNRWPIPVWITVTLLTIHGALWFDAYSVAFEYHGSCWRAVPVLAYFSTVTWVYYVKRYRQQQSAPSEPAG